MWLHSFLQCLLECSEMVWGCALSFPQRMVTDISEVACPLPCHLITVLGKVKKGKGTAHRVLPVGQAEEEPESLRGGELGGECSSSKVWAQLGWSTVNHLQHLLELTAAWLTWCFTCRSLRVSELETWQVLGSVKRKLVAQPQPKLGSFGPFSTETEEY